MYAVSQAVASSIAARTDAAVAAVDIASYLAAGVVVGLVHTELSAAGCVAASGASGAWSPKAVHACPQ